MLCAVRNQKYFLFRFNTFDAVVNQILHVLFIFLVFLLAIPQVATCQITKPLIRNIPPNESDNPDYVVSPQNWGIIQHDDGRVFLGNTSGVLIWDGDTWEMVTGTENYRFFKFAETEEGRIFTGGIGEIGYLGADSTGRCRFVSIKDQLPEEVRDFERIFRVESDGESVFFLGGNYLFKYQGGEFQVFEDQERFSRLFIIGEEVYVTTKTSLYHLKSGKLDLLGDWSGQLDDLQIRGLFNSANPESPNEMMVVSKKRGLFKWDWEHLTAMKSDLDTVDVFNIAFLDQGKIGVGTNGDGFFVLDTQGEVEGIINEASGIQNTQVPFPYQGKYGGVWLCLYVGLSRVDYQSPIEMFGEEDNLTSLVMSLYSYGGQLYIGTTDGLYTKPSAKETKIVKWAVESGEVLGFLELGQDLWMIAARGIFQVNAENRVGKYFELNGAEGFCRSSIDSEKLFVSMVDQTLRSIVFNNGKWSWGNDSIYLPFYGNTVVQGTDGKVWVANESLSFATFDSSGAKILEVDSSYGLPADMGSIEVQVIQGEVLISGQKGIFRWDDRSQRLVPFEKFGPDFTLGNHSAYNLTETSKGDVWITSDFETGLLRKTDGDQFVLDTVFLRSVPISDYFEIYEDPEGIFWLGGTEGLIRYDPSIAKDYHQDYHTLIRQVTVNNDSVIFYGTFADESGLIVSDQPESYQPTLEHVDNHLTFRYSAPFYEAHEKLRYSHQLIGQEDKWTSWTAKTETEYTNLHEGRYTFRVRARNAYGTISKVAEYRFEILPPWYRTIWAYLFYGLVVVLGVVLIVRLNTRRLLAAKRRLEGIVDERTREIQRQLKQLAKQKEIISEEKEKSESLLLNILPKATSEELKEKGTASPMYFEQVSVLFTDFKGFTMISERLSPKQLVDEIHECFSEFDRITRRHGIEKIKTIGDAYMAAGGLPEPNTTNPVDVVRAALEIRDYMKRYFAERAAVGEQGFEIRLGVHTGPVVAGIVGLHKFQYDIWGDAVNTAARMESSGEVAKVNISQATYELVKDEFECTYRGKVKAKNKGEIAMYFVEWKDSE